MKKFKKALTLALMCILLVNCTIPCFATDQDADVAVIGSASASDITEISEIAETYMRRYAENTYMYESNDLKELTVASLSPTERQALQQAQNTLSTNVSASSNLNENFNAGADSETNLAVNTLDTMDYTLEKANYRKNVRQMQNILRKDFETCYQVNQIEVSGDYARVWLSENIGFYYSGQTIQSIISEEYEISLFRPNGEWLIYNIYTKYDDFDSTNKFSGFNSAEAIQEFSEIYANRDSGDLSEKAVIVSEEDANAEIQSTVFIPRTYNAQNAVYYAFTYSKQNVGNFRSYYNGNFESYDGRGGDCMNFASQCIYAGFHGSNAVSDINSKSFPQDNVGSSSDTTWFGSPASHSWISNSPFYNYITKSASDSGTRIKGSVTTYGYNDYYITTPTKLLGAVIQVPGSAGDYQHAVIVTGQEGTGRDQILITSHTGDHKHVRLGDLWGTGKIWVILPTSAVQTVSCTSAEHSYTSIPYDRGLDSICNICGTSRLFIRNTLLNCVPVGTTKTLTAYPSVRCYRMAMKVVAPNGAVSWLGEVVNDYSYAKNYTFSQTGLYTITLYARDINPDYYRWSTQVHHTYTVRCY